MPDSKVPAGLGGGAPADCPWALKHEPGRESAHATQRLRKRKSARRQDKFRWCRAAAVVVQERPLK